MNAPVPRVTKEQADAFVRGEDVVLRILLFLKGMITKA